ncbi:MAG: PKD domain-containing protein [Candidatus Thermoplasmatota archaeon]|nr:PKD domain-containing protein [Candidatus Thermoplasmatota archaeon]
MVRTGVPAIVMMLLVLLAPATIGTVPDGTVAEKGPVIKEDGPSGPILEKVQAPAEGQIQDGPMDMIRSDLMLSGARPSIEGVGLSQGFDASKMGNIVSPGEGLPYQMTSSEIVPSLTRASDLENEKGYYDCANGSLVEVPMEVVAGTLSYVPEGQSDLRDWYKLRLVDVEPIPNSPNGLHWIRLHLLSYSNGTGGTEGLYEYKVIEGTPPTLESDYGDTLGITVLYYDPWQGLTYLGGEVFFYDDMDDTDGTSHRSGWYYNCTSPVASTGQEDLDGFANGLTEVGWYYIGINLDYYIKTGAPARGTYSVRYELMVDTSERISSDEGANIRETAMENAPSGESTITSHTDHVDWYKFKGTDTSKIWNQSFTINRTMGLGGRIGEVLYDTWVYVYVMMQNPGADGSFGTSDDGWEGYFWTFSFYLSGGGFVSNPAQSVSLTVNNTYTSSPDRYVYLGLYVEPAKILISGSTIIAFLDPDWSTVTNITMDYHIREEQFNQRPLISSLSVSSSNPNYPTQGDLRDTFTFDVIYSDPDNDPPGRLDLFVGPKKDVWTTFSLLGKDKDPSDTKFSDGKTYQIRLSGEELGSYPVHHSVKVNGTDRMQEWSLRVALPSKDRWMNDTLFVFDDRPVVLNVDFEDIDPLTEDGGRYSILLEKRTGNGPFDDPENDFRGFNIWDASGSRWVTDISVVPIKVNISRDPSEGWLLYLEPLPNAHGDAVIRLRAYDDHSSIERNVPVIVDSVNDPPAFLSVTAGTRTFPVTEVLPQKYKVDLKGQYDLNEDTTYTIDLNAVDTDPEADRGQLVYGFVPSRSDNWDVDPVLDADSGQVTIKPTNNDAKGKSSRMTFEVTDGPDTAELEVLFTVKNVNDMPELSVPDTTLEADQGDRLRIQPVGRDMDMGDTLVYSVNMVDDLGTQYGSVISQLPFFDPVKGVDWDIDTATGEFWFEPSHDGIWRDPGALLMERTIYIVIQVKDKSGAIATVQITVRLFKADIWVPRTPELTYDIDDTDPITPGVQGLTIELTAGEFDTVLYPGWEYSWELGDGSRVTGRTVTHTYLQEGYRSISLRLTKDSSNSNPRFLNITLEAPEEEKPEPPGGGNGGSGWMIITIIAFVLVLIVLIVVALLFLRGRGGREASEGGQGSLPSGQDRALGPSYQQKALPTKGPEGRCPKCGAPVSSGWFICPSCKTQLN